MDRQHNDEGITESQLTPEELAHYQAIPPPVKVRGNELQITANKRNTRSTAISKLFKSNRTNPYTRFK